MVSAWTNTGLTMLPDPEILPITLAVFRVFIQWLSRLGFILFLLYFRELTPHSNLFHEESADYEPKEFWRVGKVAVLINSAYTFIGVILLRLTGIPLYHSLTHTLTTISAGGFSTNRIGVGMYRG